MLAIKNNPNASSKLTTSKIEILERFDNLPQEVRQGLDSGTLKLADTVFYSTKALGGATTKELMEASDTQKEGFTNMNNRKLEAGRYFLPLYIRLLGATIEGTDAITDKEIANAEFKVLPASILNGEMEIQVSGKTAFSRNSCHIFDKDASDEYKGAYQVENTFCIAPQSEIVPNLRLNTNVDTSRLVVRFEMMGAMIIPA